jgi:ubiquinone/menaquinone biosynthesis C-methylase UbiE
MPERDDKNKLSGTGAGNAPPERNPQKQEINRIRSKYEERDAGMPFDDWQKNIYHPRHPLGKLFREHNHDVLVHVLDSLDIDLETMHVLDVGCGHGWWLRDLVELGADPGRLTGIDLSRERIEIAHKRNPGIHWIHGNSEELPFPSESFDLVMQVVVFSSVLDTGVQNHLASEMKRVVKDNGYILWIDHKQPVSGELSGFSKEKVLELFDGFDIIHARSVHPRYFRRMYRLSPALAKVLYRITKAGCDSWALVLKGKHAG